MSCQDEVKDAMIGADHSQRNQDKAEGLALACTKRCVDTHIALLKSIQYKVETDIDKLVKQ